jgi:sporulation and spore germination protein
MQRRLMGKNVMLFGALGTALAVGLIVLGLNVRAPHTFRQPLDMAAPGTELKTVLVYYLEPDSLRLVPRPREVTSGEGRRGVVNDLVSYLSRPEGSYQAPLPPGTELLHYFEADPGSIVLDLSASVTNLGARSIDEERLRLTALARTIGENVDGVKRIRLLVLGSPLEQWGRHLRPGPWVDVDQW